MKISILVPIYKTEKYIERCARSLFEQTYKDIEYIFVDDCTPDKSLQILQMVIQNYPKRIPSISIIRNKRNSGIAQVRNTLLNCACGDYVYFVDSDDYIEKSAIEKFVQIVHETNADIVRCNYKKSIGIGQYEVEKNPLVTNKHQLLEQSISSLSGVDAMWKLFIRRALFTENNLIFEPGINACEDYIMSVKLFWFSQTTVDIDDVLYYYTMFGNVSSITKNNVLCVEDRMKAIEAVRKFLMEKEIFKEYERSLSLRILMCKQAYLIQKDKLDLDKYLNLYPEVNKVWRNFSYGRRESFLFWLAEHNCRFLIKLLYYLRSL